MRFLDLAFLVLVFGFYPAFASGISTTIPSASATNQKIFWRSFMTATYGTYNKQMKCWVSGDSTGKYCMRPHSFETIDVGSRKQIFATVAGAIISKDGNDCHACNGNIGFFVLDASGKNLNIIAQSARYKPDGVNGRAPSAEGIKLRLIGPNGNYGWTVDNFDFGQGVAIEATTIKGVIGDQVLSLGTVPKSFNNDEDCEDNKTISSGEPCSDYKYEASFDTAKPNRFSPIILRSTGVLKGDTYTKTFIVPFDEKTFLYQLPKELADQ